MHTSLSKKLLAGLLSLVMVLSLVAPSISSQAASKYTLTDKSSVKCGVTLKYRLKGVSKNQYVKVTRNVSGEKVVYNKKSLTKTTKIKGTGKTLNLYVTYGDKVANYTGKFTVRIYNKKTNKLVKTIVEKTTVKVTPLEVTNVEVASTNGKYLVAYFNKPLSTLKAADVEVREKNTNTLKGVSDVELASDGKSATVTLVGAEDSYNDFCEANVDYVFTVTQSGVSASTTFTMDAVEPNVTITATNASKATVTTSKGTTLTVPESLSVDFQEVLGRTATVWFDKDLAVTKLVLRDEEVVYGAFKVVAGASYTYLIDADGNCYYTQDSENTASSTITRTRNISKDSTTAGFKSGAWYTGVAGNAPIHNSTFAYAKLVLNSNGTIKTMVTVKDWTNVSAISNGFLVEKVDNNRIIAGKQEQSLQYFTIVKDGKTISVSDIQAGDMVFYDTAAYFAEVYNNTVSAKVSAVYANRFAFNGKTYNNAKVKYIQTVFPYAIVAVDEEQMSKYYAAGKEATVYYDRSGEPIFITGDEGAAAYTYQTVVLTEAAKGYTYNLSEQLHIVGWNGTKVATYDIPLSQLETITMANGTNVKVNGTTVTGFVGEGVTFNAVGNAAFKVENKKDGTDYITGIAAGSAIVLQIDANNKIVGINVKAAEGLASLYKTGVLAATTFATGYTALTTGVGTYQIGNDVPVYTFDCENDTFEETTYGKFAGSVAAATINNAACPNNTNAYTLAQAVKVYTYDGKNVAAIVVTDKHLVTGNTTSNVTKEVVVSAVEYDLKGRMCYLKVVSGAETKEYTEFVNNIATAVETGDIINLTTKADLTTVYGVAQQTPNVVFGTIEEVNGGNQSITLGDGSEHAFSTTVEPTIVEIDTTDAHNPVVVPIDLATLQSYLDKYGLDDCINISYLGGTTNVDTLVVTWGSASLSMCNYLVNQANTGFSVATKANYTTYKTRMDLAKAAIASYVAAGGSTADVTAYGTFTTNLAALEAAGKKIVDSVVVKTPAVVTGTDGACTAAAPVLTIKSVDGTEYTETTWEALGGNCAVTYADATTGTATTVTVAPANGAITLGSSQAGKTAVVTVTVKDTNNETATVNYTVTFA